MKKLLLTILFLSLVVVSTACSLDDSNSSNLSTDIEKKVSSSYESLDELPQEYSSKEAQMNGDVVGVHGEGFNIDKLDKFINDIESNNDDFVRITTYTIEGDAIIYDLIKTNNGIKLIVDNTRDEFSSIENRIKKEYNVVEILKEKRNGQMVYTAKLDTGDEITLIFIDIE